MVHHLTCTLLLVDDDPPTLALVGLFEVHVSGVVLLTAMSVREAEPFLPRADVILCDVTMPEQPGSALLIAAQRLTSVPSVMMMTGLEDAALFAHLLELEAVAVFMKPLRRDSILPAICCALDRECFAVSSGTSTDPSPPPRLHHRLLSGPSHPIPGGGSHATSRTSPSSSHPHHDGGRL
jgi:DNA-binding NarL/FixJ family response regulator